MRSILRRLLRLPTRRARRTTLRITHAGKPWAHLRVGVGVGLVIGLLVSLLYGVGALERTELRTLDLRFLARFLLDDPQVDSGPITVVAIDERSLEALGPWPWPMDIQARLIEALTQGGVKAIGLGYLLTAADGLPEGTVALADALEVNGNVVLAAASQGASDVLPPTALRDVAAAVGMIDLLADRDGVIRQIPIRSQSTRPEPFAVALARQAGAQIPGQYRGGTMLINYRPPANDARMQLHRWVQTVSAVDVLDGVVSPHLAGQVAIVGTTASVFQDRYTTPLTQQVPAVYIQAFAVRSLLLEDHIVRVPSSVTWVGLWVMSVVGCALALLLRPWILTLLALATATVTAIVSAVLFVASGLWIEITPWITVQSGTFVAGLAYAYSVVDRDTRRVRGLFRRYVAPEVVDRLLQDAGAVEAGKRAHVTILFADIRGFTSFAEQVSPEHAVQTLDRCLQAMADAVLAHGGTLDKYIGDAVMAVFGAPFERSDHAQAAFDAALDIRRRIAQLAPEIRHPSGGTLRVGIGIHTGVAVVGSIGSHLRREYTAIGDVVNVASRLEEAAGAGQILLSHATVVACGKDAPVNGMELSIRGRHDSVLVYVIPEDLSGPWEASLEADARRAAAASSDGE